MQYQKYVKMPVDPFSVKQKVFAGLTKRQLTSFVIGGACGIIPFFIVKSFAGVIGGMVALFIFAAPAVFCGLYERNGIGFDKQLKMMINFYKKPRKLLFRSRNAAELAMLISEKQELKKILKRGTKNG